jgi:DNA-directed RNA polymerase subunit RPC12/RpoP
MILTLILVAGTTLTAAILFWARWRSGSREPYQVFRCPDCGQKVRYPESRAGRPAACPRCRQRLAHPVTRLSRAGRSGDTAAQSVGRLAWRATRLAPGGVPARQSR